VISVPPPDRERRSHARMLRRAARARRSWIGAGLTQGDWRLLLASRILCENDNGRPR
jgi:hypothetical protein